MASYFRTVPIKQKHTPPVCVFSDFAGWGSAFHRKKIMKYSFGILERGHNLLQNGILNFAFRSSQLSAKLYYIVKTSCLKILPLYLKGLLRHQKCGVLTVF